MFSRAFRLLRMHKPIITASLLTIGYGFKKVLFTEQKQDSDDNLNLLSQIFKSIQANSPETQAIRKIIEQEVCSSNKIREGQLYFVDVQEPDDETAQNGGKGKKYTIAIGRVKGKLYAVLAHCTYKQPFSQQTIESNNFKDSIIFNQKLYCPHHGCAFSIQSGTVQYGPANRNLPKFFVQQKNDKVFLYYPSKIPTSVIPRMGLRNLNDLRKVVIIGGDHHATMGVIDGLKLYDYEGELTIIHNDGEFEYPYRQDLLHKNLCNLNKDSKQQKKFKPSQIEKVLDQKIYSKLYFQSQMWYKALGIEFVFNNSIYRVINKKYYPYIKFLDNTKLQFDGIVYATGFLPRFPQIPQITTHNKSREQMYAQSSQIINRDLHLPQNVFAPYYNKIEHLRLNKFLNMNTVKSMIVLGMNVESLEFIEAVKREFPGVAVKVIDCNKENCLTEVYGPDIGQEIIKQYTKRNVQFYIKLQQIPKCTNKLAEKQQSSQNLGLSLYQLKFRDSKFINPKLFDSLPKQNTQLQQTAPRITDSISVKLDMLHELKADCMVLFPNNTVGNTEYIQTAKYVDIDYNKINSRIIVDPNSRTDTKRMFAAGSCTNIQFFFLRQKIELINPLMAHQQGMTAGYNLNALNVPFHYIPFETHRFFGKKILYAGIRKNFDSMYIMGDVKTWDFIAFYAVDQQIVAVSATQSRQKQFQVVRQSFRLQCAPQLKSIVQGKWTIPLLYKLIRKLEKSGCYKDLIHTLSPEMNIPDVIWMDRENGTFVTNQKDDDDSNLEYDAKGYVKEV